MTNNQVLDVSVIDIFDYKIARFRLQLLGQQFAVSMMEDAAKRLMVAFPNTIPLTILIGEQEPEFCLWFAHYPSGVDACPRTLEQVFGADVPKDEFRRLTAQIRPVARLFGRMERVDAVEGDTAVCVVSSPAVGVLAAA